MTITNTANGWIVTRSDVGHTTLVFKSMNDLLTEVYRQSCSDWKVGDHIIVMSDKPSEIGGPAVSDALRAENAALAQEGGK